MAKITGKILRPDILIPHDSTDSHSPSKIILQLGGNLGDVKKTFSDVVSALSEEVGKIIKTGSFYKSKAWGFESDDAFTNQVIELETSLLPHDLLHLTQKIEKRFGREKKTVDGYESRPVDIDILFYGDSSIETPDLTIPHKLMTERRFVLEPLREFWSEKKHPRLMKTVKELYESCPDSSEIIKEE
ncbi:2-amino-4-hydroxy-6-hydroxymethyldihydropteridine diphosphokinase [Aduncisulcus paluster]|uniref:2-amino-4-hydroxy-6-hydroxymethyldihydropteridine diphosphokinase n=1 Tax=Aduncisulcus paluster TaxID=2918883 RepID=A0ABQ5KPR4_9EUKA|nr:2-amino-4-hydroxy-6-hydroxymethyldihydropteridine diphosphokinase [Aduncisulcus paluster]